MTQAEALQQARVLWPWANQHFADPPRGDESGFVVGANQLDRDGVILRRAFGCGDSWEEAFAVADPCLLEAGADTMCRCGACESSRTASVDRLIEEAREWGLRT